MKTLKLRPYQQEALDALAADWDTGLVRLAVVLPTGLGKTVVFSHLIHQAAMRPGERALVMVHREELAQQAADKIRSVAPDLKVGIVKAERNELDADVIVASVQTLARPSRRSQIPADSIGMVIVDECHHAVARTWVDVLDYFGCFEEYGTPAVGFTATLSREDGRGLGDVWQKVSYTKDILYGIQHDPPYLVDVRGKAVAVDGLDLATVAKSRGDYQEGQLGDALEASGAGEVIASSYREHAADRQGVIFAPTVATAHSFADDMNAAGFVTEVITGATPREDRELIYKRYAAGDVQVLSNCMVLTEGWDAPWASCAVIARPTQSAALYIQMVGRVLRPWPGKPDALVLDVVGVSGRHALRSICDLTATGVTVNDGESLGEAIDRDAKEKGKRPAGKGKATGIISAADVDLFHRSTSVWLKTYGGIWFIPTREWTYFLWPAEDGIHWNVGRKPAWNNRGEDRGGWRQLGMTLEYAMAWGEQEAAELDPSVSSKRASWRRKSNKPSDAQIGLLARYGLPITEGMSRSDASDLISIHIASRQLDRAAR
jgi:superfamily II DNA or RNA helicase